MGAVGWCNDDEGQGKKRTTKVNAGGSQPGDREEKRSLISGLNKKKERKNEKENRPFPLN